ncbi:MFS transporter [Solirubrobacter phytolaccae]|uniref:MFS transporter n=1 Tax=Solirubrobacter phytolaccae TaxID=1404360 RepID=A0A9X3SCH2_9ACTN|nr:MFS transporter [Solirubrobacter phytolaccae]MDA0184686.1 MFS transporter [Solirubrobacter phytolaccae]
MTLRDALATPDLRRLQAAWAAAAFGGWVFMVALAVHAYGEGGAAAVGLAALTRMVPAGLAAPLLGRVADRCSRRDVLLASTLIRAVLLGALALAAAAHVFAATLVLGALFTIAQAAHKPAQAALIPHLTDRPAAANALWSTIDNAAFILGALAGGILAAAIGAPAAFAGATLTFLLAAALLTNIKRDCPSLATGVAFSALDRRARVLVAVLSVSTLVEGMVDVLVVVTALEIVDVGEAGVGWLNGAWGVGGVLGGVLALRVATRALPLGTVLVGAPLLALAALPGPAAALVALTTLGVGYSLVETAGITLIQRLTHDAVRARTFARLESSYWLTTGAGAMLAPLVIALTSPRGALVIAGAALPLAALLTKLVPLRVATAARPAAA